MNNILSSFLIIIFLLLSGHTRAQQKEEMLLKGIAYRQLEGEGEECTDIDKLSVSWYYNWTPVPNCPPDPDIEFIPMIWSEKYLFDENYKKYLLPLVGSDYSALLGYNEPNWDGQAEMSVKTALKYWHMLEKTGLRLGSPATTGRSGLDWSIEFMKGVKEKGYRVDFLALHWYGDCSCIDDLKSFLDYYDAWGMPMWLTEWSCYQQDMKTNTEFLKKAIPVKIPDIQLEIIGFHEGPVLGENDPGTEDIQHGFEGGRVIKHKGEYHLFTSEQSGVWANSQSE